LDAASLISRRSSGVSWIDSAPILALGVGSVGIYHATDCGQVAGLEFGNVGTNLLHAAKDFVADNARVDRRHEFTPLVADLAEVGMTDAAVKNFDLDVVVGWVAPRDRGRG
jgi:hypothetical protein